MAPEGIVEPVDVAANGPVRLLAGIEDGPPDELGFQGLEEPLHHGVVVALPLAGDRDQDSVFLELGLRWAAKFWSSAICLSENR
jgi:hypothetical protein